MTYRSFDIPRSLDVLCIIILVYHFLLPFVQSIYIFKIKSNELNKRTIMSYVLCIKKIIGLTAIHILFCMSYSVQRQNLRPGATPTPLEFGVCPPLFIHMFITNERNFFLVLFPCLEKRIIFSLLTMSTLCK